jgi:hypothetical protein
VSEIPPTLAACVTPCIAAASNPQNLRQSYVGQAGNLRPSDTRPPAPRIAALRRKPPPPSPRHPAKPPPFDLLSAPPLF